MGKPARLEFHLPAPPSKLGTNHRRRLHYYDVNEITEKAKIVYSQKILEQIPKELVLEKGVPCYEFLKATFTLVVPNWRSRPDPDNLAPMIKPVVDCITVRSGKIPLLSDDSGKHISVEYLIRQGTDKKRSPWLLAVLEKLPSPPELSISPIGIGRNMDW